jgi:phenylacetic acid degradation protein
MAIYAFEGRHPSVGRGTFVHPSADIIGAVTIGQDCWIGPGARLRADYGEIIVGNGTAVEDNSVIHARPGERTTIGNLVTLGHGCIIHTATVGDYAVVGMGAVVSDWATLGEWAVVGEGAVVRQRQEIAASCIAVGVPARVLDKQVSDEYQREWLAFKQEYVNLARRYAQGLKEV